MSIDVKMGYILCLVVRALGLALYGYLQAAISNALFGYGHCPSVDIKITHQC